MKIPKYEILEKSVELQSLCSAWTERRTDGRTDGHNVTSSRCLPCDSA